MTYEYNLRIMFWEEQKGQYLVLKRVIFLTKFLLVWVIYCKSTSIWFLLLGGDNVRVAKNKK